MRGETLPRCRPPAWLPSSSSSTPPDPAPLPGDEWWYLLKVKPAGEPWLRRRGEKGDGLEELSKRSALQSPVYSSRWHTRGKKEKNGVELK